MVQVMRDEEFGMYRIGNGRVRFYTWNVIWYCAGNGGLFCIGNGRGPFPTNGWSLVFNPICPDSFQYNY